MTDVICFGVVNVVDFLLAVTCNAKLYEPSLPMLAQIRIPQSDTKGNGGVTTRKR